MDDPPSSPAAVQPGASSPFLTARELRQRWKVSAMFLWRLRQEGRLRVQKIGSRCVRYSLADIERIESESKA